MLSQLTLHFSSLATETAVLFALTLLGGLLLLLRRARTEETRLRIALTVTTVGFIVALSMVLFGFVALFIVPNVQGGI